MAVDMFLKIKGVTGEAKDITHTKGNDVFSRAWGICNSGSPRVGGGTDTVKVNVRDMDFGI
jgi:type VI secretion system secreted protein Hcp